MRVEYVNCILFIRDIERERKLQKLVTSKNLKKKVQHNTLRAQKQKQKQNRTHVSDDTVVIRKGRQEESEQQQQDEEEEEQKEETKE